MPALLVHPPGVSSGRRAVTPTLNWPCHPCGFGWGHAGGLKEFADDGGAVGLVLAERFARPASGDQDAATADAEVPPPATSLTSWHCYAMDFVYP